MTPTPLTPRATTYNGIKMRSRLEAAHAEQFDAFGWPWRYEPECFASNGGQYLPDFIIDMLAPDEPFADCRIYVEVKPWIPDRFREILGSANRWWRIIQAGDPRASGFVIMFGADDRGVLNWAATHRRIASGTAPFVSVAPVRYETRTYISHDPWLGDTICLRTPDCIPEPVPSLHAVRFWAPPQSITYDATQASLMGFG